MRGVRLALCVSMMLAAMLRGVEQLLEEIFGYDVRMTGGPLIELRIAASVARLAEPSKIDRMHAVALRDGFEAACFYCPAPSAPLGPAKCVDDGMPHGVVPALLSPPPASISTISTTRAGGTVPAWWRGPRTTTDGIWRSGPT